MKYWVIAFLLLSTTATWSRSGGQLTACKSNLKNIGTALEMWWTDNNEQYPNSLSQLTPMYLKSIPECPTMGKDSYSLTYQTSPDKRAYGLHCHGVDHHTAKNFPAYSSQDGLFESFGSASSLADCEANLKKLDELAKHYLSDKTNEISGLSSSEELGAALSNLACTSQGPGSTATKYHLSVTGDDYQFICMNLLHLHDNVMPLQPRILAQSGLTKQTFQNAPTTRKPRPKWIPALAIFGLLGIAGLAVALK